MSDDIPDTIETSGTRDTRLIAKAIRQRWPIPDQYREAVIKRQINIAINPESKPRESTAAFKSILQAEGQNLQEAGVGGVQVNVNTAVQVVERPMDRLRNAKAELAEMERKKREGQLIDRDVVYDALGRLASMLRSAGESLEREFGPKAKEIVDEAIADFRQELARTFRGDEAA